MAYQKNIYDVSGRISGIFDSNMAVISFTLKDVEQNALMTRDKFYHNGRVIAKNENWDSYIGIDMLVKFDAHNRSSVDYQCCDWCVTLCRPIKSNLSNGISIKTGFMDIPGRVIEINGGRGVLKISIAGQSHRILFTASNVYINETKFFGKYLGEVLNVYEEVSVDAIPCIRDENDEACEWFASIVYKGKRPITGYNGSTNNNEEFNLHGDFYVFWKSVYDSSIIKQEWNSFRWSLVNNDFKIQCADFIRQHINNPQTLFVSGKGIIMDILNEEFGIILGEFKKNLFQTIIFHRKNVFLYNVCLKSSNLLKILYCGDRMKFIAVGAPSGFLTDWVAVQISVFQNGLQDVCG